MVVTDDPRLSNSARYFKNLCFPLDAPRTYLHNDIGFNYRMSNLHAAIGLAQVEKADEYLAMRRRNGELYRDLLRDVPGIVFQRLPEGSTSDDYGNAYWMNSLVVEPKLYGRTRDELSRYLSSRGIETRPLFVGMDRQPSLRPFVDGREEYPVSRWLGENGLYLPSASSLSVADVTYVVDAIKEHCSG